MNSFVSTGRTATEVFPFQYRFEDDHTETLEEWKEWLRQVIEVGKAAQDVNLTAIDLLEGSE